MNWPQWPSNQAGITLASWTRDGYQTPSALRLLDRSASLHANCVSVVVTLYQDNTGALKSTEKTPSLDSLRYICTAARERGLEVMLKPHVDPEPGYCGAQWRGELGQDFGSDDWERWFSAYGTCLVDWVESLKPDRLCIGTELCASEGCDTHWRQCVDRVRAVYAGPICYAANWDREGELDWWDCVDAIGIDAYFPVTSSSPQVAWRRRLEDWKTLSDRVERPIVVTEVGYRDAGCAAERPWDWQTKTDPAPALQADLYQHAMSALTAARHVVGVFWWCLNVDDLHGPSKGQSGGYSPLDRPAETALRDGFWRWRRIRGRA